ncbi:UDP-glucose 4-epimerase GalE [Epibacterium sp. SM1979]|uniref:UDP-glucose 4-epimerase n=1 Tax=Tritonibacter litoralis TaxID=2662264 RepID=A0A843YKX5_9RHOB|nr:UDP-glucose 4-epimerase GalE [Tritonibacter litoralis]MQQ09337.1 UDP-glucose 4-epimerase GalE [Tritonibacter litoralis]
MTKPPIIVTGGAGFIGSHTCKALARAGFVPVTIDNLCTGHRDAVRWGPFELCDLRETAKLAEIIQRHQAKVVIHFAAAAYVGESVERPGYYYENNVGGTMSLLAAMRLTGLRQIIFSSSCATYGIPEQLPIQEQTPQAPINPYGRTKLICEQMIRDTAATGQLHFAMLRYFNACGADPGGELSERHTPETHLIPLALLAAAGLRPALKVFGTDYDTPDGTCIRDYIHVADLARAHVMALEWLLSGREDLIANLGTGTGLSILEILDGIEAVTGVRPPWMPAERRAGDPPELVADVSLARNSLGFRPEHSDLHTILRHAAPSFGLEVKHAS